MNEEWEKEFFAWKEEIEGKYNKLSAENLKIKEKLNNMIMMLNNISQYYETKGNYAGYIGGIK